MATNKADVIIIGAGIAGISAAHYLFSSGFKNIKILEARERIGGRIHTTSIGPDKNIVELGAQWIHGGEGNPVYRIARRHNLLDSSNVHDEFAGEYCKEDGGKVDIELLKFVIAIFQEAVEDMLDISTSGTKSKLTCNEYLSDRMSTILSRVSDDKKTEAENIFRSLLGILKEDCGDDLTNLSLMCNGFDDDFKNDDHTLPSGYQQVLEHLMENFESDVMKFKTEVRVIDWSRKENGSVVILCNQRGTEVTYEASHVICTLPLGVLKKNHKQMFRPSLPDEKVTSIEQLGFGKVNKILLYYREPFWKKGNGGIKLVWNKVEEDSLSENVYWERDIFAFKEMKHNPNILIAWVYGDSAERMESISESRVAEVCTQVLQQFLSDRNIPKPESVRISKWCTDPHTLGAYTFVTSSCHFKDMTVLSRPLLAASGKPIILFGGEATHADSYGSVHGAMLSGIREANRLKTWMKNVALT